MDELIKRLDEWSADSELTRQQGRDLDSVVDILQSMVRMGEAAAQLNAIVERV